ncbi:MAG: FecR domain-containing protein [Alphaproteobacteria bacterium]|nr:FecR domain-containing protein [Alphaproteobacteria bacterium]
MNNEKAKGLEMLAMNSKQEQDDQAARWAARMLSGDNRTPANLDLDDWKSENPAEAKDLDELLAMTQSLDAVGEQALEEEWFHELETLAEEKKRQRWFAGISSVAAGFVVVAVMAASMLFGGPEAVTFETVKGQRSTIALEDGSVVQLNTDTKLVALFEDDQRHIVVERGEAFFDVKRDEDRPFTVAAGDTNVRVLGTKFNVRLGASSNVVSVLSGLVSVAQRTDDTPKREVALLHKGEQVIVGEEQANPVVGRFDEGSVLAWRTGKALYRAVPLSDVIKDLNRYFDAKLEIGDPSIEQLPVTATFNLNDQSVVIDALESAFSIMAVKKMDGVILLYARET